MAKTRAILQPEDVFFIIFTVQDFFTNSPAESNHLSEFTNFWIFEVHLAVENKVHVGSSRLVLFVDELAWLYFEQRTILKQILEGVDCKQVEYRVL